LLLLATVLIVDSIDTIARNAVWSAVIIRQCFVTATNIVRAHGREKPDAWNMDTWCHFGSRHHAGQAFLVRDSQLIGLGRETMPQQARGKRKN